MRVQRESNGQILVLGVGTELGAGGEARVYAAPPNGALAAKIYHRPVDVLRQVGGSRRVIGFLMPRVRGLHPLVEFYNPKLRRQNCPFFDYRYLHRTARNLAAAVGAVHARGHVVGDLNESNVLASDT